MAPKCKFLSEKYNLFRSCHMYVKFSVFPGEINDALKGCFCEMSMLET